MESFSSITGINLLFESEKKKNIKGGRSLQRNKGGIMISSSIILHFLHPNNSVHLGLSGCLTKQV